LGVCTFDALHASGLRISNRDAYDRQVGVGRQQFDYPLQLRIAVRGNHPHLLARPHRLRELALLRFNFERAQAAGCSLDDTIRFHSLIERKEKELRRYW